MVAYNFKKQFAPLIKSGVKQQTIRAPRKTRHAIAGERIQIYTGMRTKSCFKLINPDPICVAVLPITIDICQKNPYFSQVSVNGTFLSNSERQELAIADGFDSFKELAKFFEPRMPFEGVLIAWGNWRPYWVPF